MEANEILMNLRKRAADALKAGLVDENGKGLLETVLIQICNEAEKNRQRCNQLALDAKRQVAMAEAQANAFSQIQSVVYAVFNGFVNAAEVQNSSEEVQELSDDEKEALAELSRQQTELEIKTTEKRRKKV